MTHTVDHTFWRNDMQDGSSCATTTRMEPPSDAGGCGDALVTALRGRAGAIVEAERARARRRLGALAPEQDEAVDALFSAIVSRLLDAPLTALEQLAREGRVLRHADAVRDVLGLG
jgi:hypothetical protein